MFGPETIYTGILKVELKKSFTVYASKLLGRLLEKIKYIILFSKNSSNVIIAAIDYFNSLTRMVHTEQG